MIRRRLQTMSPWAGLLTGAGAWAANQQINYTLAPWMCGSSLQAVPVISVALALVALAGGFVSARVWWSRSRPASKTIEADGLPSLFLAGIGLGAAVLFAIVILVQGAAGLVFTGCER
jgi:hypothetical protein